MKYAIVFLIVSSLLTGCADPWDFKDEGLQSRLPPLGHVVLERGKDEIELPPRAAAGFDRLIHTKPLVYRGEKPITDMPYAFFNANGKFYGWDGVLLTTDIDQGKLVWTAENPCLRSMNETVINTSRDEALRRTIRILEQYGESWWNPSWPHGVN